MTHQCLHGFISEIPEVRLLETSSTSQTLIRWGKCTFCLASKLFKNAFIHTEYTEPVF